MLGWLVSFLCVAILQFVVIYPFKNWSQIENQNIILNHNVSFCKNKQTKRKELEVSQCY